MQISLRIMLFLLLNLLLMNQVLSAQENTKLNATPANLVSKITIQTDSMNSFFQDPFITSVFYTPPSKQIIGSAANLIAVKNSIIVKRLPGVPSAELLLELNNPGYKDFSLIKVICPIAKEIQLQTSNVNKQQGVSLVKINNIPLMSRTDLSLQPNGYHIMLINLTKPVQIGDMIPTTLIFNDGSQLDIIAVVSV